MRSLERKKIPRWWIYANCDEWSDEVSQDKKVGKHLLFAVPPHSYTVI